VILVDDMSLLGELMVANVLNNLLVISFGLCSGVSGYGATRVTSLNIKLRRLGNCS